MGSLSFRVGLVLLIIGSNGILGNVWGADWKMLADATTGVFQFDSDSIRRSPEGFVRVWIHNGTKQESSLVEFNCKGEGYRVLDVVEYDQNLRIRARHDYYDNPGWSPVTPGSVLGPLSGMVCQK